MKAFKWYSFLIICFFFTAIQAQEESKLEEGFFDYTWHDQTGKITLHVDKDRIDQEYLYVNSLAAGVGSNDIGLDRGQLGGTRIVKFIKSGNKLLLIQPNYDYRANSPNKKEIQAVEEAFASSVIGGFVIKKQSENQYDIDITDFLLRDSHNVTSRLKSRNQGTYKLDPKRSAIWKDNTLNFPKNTEFESILTFAGEAKGAYIRSVTPSSDAVSVRTHHSFIELPDNKYTPREYHPFSGYINMRYFDYATPIQSPIEKRFIVRHRLEKKNPNARRSEAIEPIIYYLDPGCPEPIKSALIEGASWWNQAFEKAGFINAFQVKELPEGAHSLDVRYNMIQWVHRSTRGWSYGSSVRDPRTGEIIKGHVSLGSLRVRQDFMIAQGLLSPYGEGDDRHDQMLEIALARLRQLSAHEVGHTIGLVHNYASSIDNRASVMDYPHPKFTLDENGNISYVNAYDDKIGVWDSRAIIFGYQDFPESTDEITALNDIIHETQRMGLHFISDRDSRPAGSAHPYAHLWDNGENAIQELENLMAVRKKALENFGKNTIPSGIPFAELEKILVPVYLLGRYQIEATSKIIGGLDYTYAVKGDAQDFILKDIPLEVQMNAAKALLSGIKPSQLMLPASIKKLIPPPPQGYSRTRESFGGNTGLVFDYMGTAESLTHHTLSFMLHPQRLARLARYADSANAKPALKTYLNLISTSLFDKIYSNSEEIKLQLLTQEVYFTHLLKLFSDPQTGVMVKSQVLAELDYLRDAYLSQETPNMDDYTRQVRRLMVFIEESARRYPDKFTLPKMTEMPPGSPIGCGENYYFSMDEK